MTSRKKSERRKKKLSGRKKVVGGKKKWEAEKNSKRRTKSRLKKERRDTCLLRKRREEIDVPLKAPKSLTFSGFFHVHSSICETFQISLHKIFSACTTYFKIISPRVLAVSIHTAKPQYWLPSVTSDVTIGFEITSGCCWWLKNVSCLIVQAMCGRTCNQL